MVSQIHFRAGLEKIALLLSAALLSACGDNQVAFLDVDGRGQSVSVVREQPYLAGPWKTTLIVANASQCQRRYPLEGLTTDQFEIDVFLPEPGVYILGDGKRWHVTELASCAFQTYRRPPPEPGEPVGSFQAVNGELKYLDKAAGSRSRARR